MGSPTRRAPAIGRGKTDSRLEGIINSNNGAVLLPHLHLCQPQYRLVGSKSIRCCAIITLKIHHENSD